MSTFSNIWNRTNHPNTTVYCQDSSALLKHAVLSAQNPINPPPPLVSLDTTKPSILPALPLQEKNIDFIFGGKSLFGLLS